MALLLMQDTKGAVGKLEMIFALLIHAISGLAYLAIFNVSSSISCLDLPAAHANHAGIRVLPEGSHRVSRGHICCWGHAEQA